MLDTAPLQRSDGWSVAGIMRTHFDLRAISDLTRWLDRNQTYHNHHAVLIEHAG